jgi:hypothetical protein
MCLDGKACQPKRAASLLPLHYCRSQTCLSRFMPIARAMGMNLDKLLTQTQSPVGLLIQSTIDGGCGPTTVVLKPFLGQLLVLLVEEVIAKFPHLQGILVADFVTCITHRHASPGSWVFSCATAQDLTAFPGLKLQQVP